MARVLSVDGSVTRAVVIAQVGAPESIAEKSELARSEDVGDDECAGQLRQVRACSEGIGMIPAEEVVHTSIEFVDGSTRAVERAEKTVWSVAKLFAKLMPEGLGWSCKAFMRWSFAWVETARTARLHVVWSHKGH